MRRSCRLFKMSYRFVDLRTNTDKTGEMTRLPRFRNPAAALGLLPTPRSCRLPNSPASSPDCSRVASPDLETSPMPHTSSVSHSPPAPEASPESPGMLTPQTSPQPYRCVCQRPQSLIMCSSCGFTFTGRVRSPCSAHPSQIYLMDNEVCPECSSACLREYKY